MGGCRLRNFVVRFGFDRMNQIGKFDRVLNKKDRNIIADEIVIAFFGVKFHGEIRARRAPDRSSRESRRRSKSGQKPEFSGSCRSENPAFVYFFIDS